jgi:hypothetical protein
VSLPKVADFQAGGQPKRMSIQKQELIDGQGWPLE